MNGTDLLQRISTPTNWKMGDRVLTRRFGAGTVVVVQEGTGAADGLQVLGIELDRDGTMLVSVGGEVEAVPA